MAFSSTNILNDCTFVHSLHNASYNLIQIDKEYMRKLKFADNYFDLDRMCSHDLMHIPRLAVWILYLSRPQFITLLQPHG